MTTGKPLTMAEVISFAKSVDKKTWGKVGAITAGVLILWFFVIAPAWFERPALRREIQTMTSQIRQVTVLNQKRPVLEQNLKAYHEVITKVKDRLFTAEGVGLLLGQISKMADESHMEVLASKPQKDKVVYAAPYNLKYSAIGYDFTVQGGYHDLGQLVNRIESYDRLLRIQGLHITPSEKFPEKHNVELKVLAVTVAPPAPPPPKVPNAKK